MNTIDSRVDSLQDLSQEVYRAIDVVTSGGETRAHQIVLIGVATVANVLRYGPDPTRAGDIYHAQLLGQLARENVAPSLPVYEPWPRYRKSVQRLLDAPQVKATANGPIDRLAAQYANVRRRTINSAGERETDASHVVHLSALALPYAAEYYPKLDQSKIALYCLIHDILEAYTGDTATLGISEAALAQKHARESRALRQLSKDYAHEWPDFVRTVYTYEHLSNDEAKFVKTFDKLDPSFTHFTNRGLQLRQFYHYTSADQFLAKADETTQRMGYAHNFPELLQDRQELLDRIAQQVPWSDTLL